MEKINLLDQLEIVTIKRLMRSPLPLTGEFSTIDFRNIVECKMKLSQRTAENWLSDMARCNVIKDAGYGKWIKNLKVIEENEME